MQITFDTTTITDDEVRGIFALLDTVRPEALTSSDVEPTKDFNEWISEKGVKLTEETAKWVAGPSDTVAMFKVNMPDGTTKTVEGDDPTEPADGNFTPTTDANGLPWDERIHSGTKALNADGTWRTKRGVDKALVAEVEAELRQRDTFEVPEGQEAVLDEEGRATGETVAVAAPPAPPALPAPEAPKAPLAPASSVAETTPPAPTTTSPFVALMKRVTTAQGAGKLTQPRVKELLESLDKKSIMDLRTDDDALASFAVLLDGEGV